MIIALLTADYLWTQPVEAKEFQRAKSQILKMQKLYSGKVIARIGIGKMGVPVSRLDSEPLPTPYPPESPIEVIPVRQGRFRAKVTRESIDYSSENPVWRSEVICEVLGPAPVFDFENERNKYFSIPTMGCHIKLDRQEGDLLISAYLTLDKEAGHSHQKIKAFSSSFYFIPDSPSESSPTTPPEQIPKVRWSYFSDGSNSYTRDLDLRHLGMYLNYGTYLGCIVAPPLEPSPNPNPGGPGGEQSLARNRKFTKDIPVPIPVPGVSDEEPAPPCRVGGHDTISVKVDLEDQG